jgi:chaperonin GroES
MNVRPLKDLVVVEKEEAPTRSAGGLHLPGTVDEKTLTGVVKAVGPGKVNDAGVLVPVAVQVGDRVVFSRSTVIEVKVGTETVSLVQESSLLCVISE